MSIIQAIIYGIVQGITEFLPISSTAHLVLIPWLFGWEEPGVYFDIALHLGTAVAVVTFFFKDWILLIRAGLTQPKSPNGRLFWLLVIATIPGGLFGVVLSQYMEDFRTPILIGIMLIIMGILLYAADKYSRSDVHLKETGLKRSLIVGIAQIFAIVPGVSRSGVTITTGRMLGMTRESIARFTFLLSTPIILGDGLYHAKDIINSNIETAPFIIGILTSAIVGIIVIKFLLDYLKKNGFGIFAVYRLLLGAFVIILSFFK